MHTVLMRNKHVVSFLNRKKFCSIIILKLFQQKITDGNVRNAVFSALNPGTPYTVTVRGVIEDENLLIESPPGQTVAVTSNKSLPLNVAQLVA